MRTTFAETVKQVAQQNAASLVDRAHVASRLAKLCGGRARRALYEAKSRALSRAVEVCPEVFRPAWSNCRQTFVLLRCRVAASLHVPVRELSPGAAKWLQQTG